MTYALFEEAGRLQAGRVIGQGEASSQVELESGKRVKVKAANTLMTFESPAPAQLMSEAQALGATIELELAWEFAPEDEFGFAELAQEYFSSGGGKASTVQQAAALLRLAEAPHYFRRAGKGRFRKAPAEIVQQALAAIERKKQQQAQVSAWAEELGRGACPQPIRDQLFRILFKPDKNAPEYKAVVEAARATQKAPLVLLREAGAINSPYQFHWKRFLFENFPQGTGFGTLEAPPAPTDLPLAELQAFSIDDSQTTEIDDALSVRGLGSGTVTLGIHIAAPALAFEPGSPLDKAARSRYSTVYMPGAKLTMLPDAVVQHYTLKAGDAVPALSLHAEIDEATLEVLGSRTALERVPVAANLRHDQLDAIVTESWLAAAAPPPEAALQAVPEAHAQLAFLHRFALHLKAQREKVRGKPELFSRPDYTFRIDGADGEPTGSETVRIETRRRGAPLDLIVAEAMILANSTWGGWLHQLGLPGIYRSQASLAPGVKVRMGTKSLPHAGIGVPSYAWSTSPLRRYTDLVNQWQLVAAVRNGRTAALAAPFKAKDAELFSIVSGFDAAYGAYQQHQATMERFWTLKYLEQQGIAELTVAVIKDMGHHALARAEDLPLVLPVAGAQGLPRGTRLRVKLGPVDEIALDVGATLVERLDRDAGVAADAGEEDEEPAAGPIAIAVDVEGSEGAAPDNPAS